MQNENEKLSEKHVSHKHFLFLENFLTAYTWRQNDKVVEFTNFVHSLLFISNGKCTASLLFTLNKPHLHFSSLAICAEYYLEMFFYLLLLSHENLMLLDENEGF